MNQFLIFHKILGLINRFFTVLEMDYCLGGESPAILQLHKWAPSKFNIDLSEFREGFISPTRELLLLLSYQCEALLLPLVAGKYTSPKSFCLCML